MEGELLGFLAVVEDVAEDAVAQGHDLFKGGVHELGQAPVLQFREAKQRPEPALLHELDLLPSHPGGDVAHDRLALSVGKPGDADIDGHARPVLAQELALELQGRARRHLLHSLAADLAFVG